MEWMPQYNWRKHLAKDAIAGVTIGIVLIPQGLAYATLAGLPPVYGVYTGFPSLLYALFGTSRHAAIGPMSLPALLMASAVSDLQPATPEEYIGQIMALTFICGLLLFLMGWLNMGFIVRFISAPVLSGFTSAAAIMTIVSVVKDLIGSNVPRSQVLQDYVIGIAKAIPGIHLPTLTVGIAGLLMLHYAPRVKKLKSVPPALLVVVISIIVFAAFMWVTGDAGGDGLAGYATKQGIALVGAVPSSFPIPKLPPFSRFMELLPTAFGLLVVGYVESIAVAKLYALKYGYEINPSSELKALGVTNMGGAVLQSFLVMGAFGRSAVNDSAGAKSQMSGVVSVVVVVALLLFVMPALYYLPRAILAAMIMMAVRTLIKYHDVPRLWKVDKRDLLNMAAAFVSTLFLGVLPGIVLSMLFSLVLFIYHVTQPQVQELGRLTGTVIYRELGLVGVSRVPEVKVLAFNAPVMFFNCSVLKDRLLVELANRKKLPPRLQWRALVLSFSSVTNVDSTSIQTLEEVVNETLAQRVPFLIAGCNAYVEDFLTSSGFVAKLGGPSFLFRRVHEAVRAVLWNEINEASLPAPLNTPIAQASSAGDTPVPDAATAIVPAGSSGGSSGQLAALSHGLGGSAASSLRLPSATADMKRGAVQKLTHVANHLKAIAGGAAAMSAAAPPIAVDVKPSSSAPSSGGPGNGTGSEGSATGPITSSGSGSHGGSVPGQGIAMVPTSMTRAASSASTQDMGSKTRSLASQQVAPSVHLMQEPLIVAGPRA